MEIYDSRPVGGIDYLCTLQEFDQWFATEQDCLAYLQRLRWPDGFICPNCKGRKAWHMGSGLIRCFDCHDEVSVIAGTLFHGTKKPLKLWFQAIWYINESKIWGKRIGA